MYVHFQKRNMEIRTKAANKFMMVPNAYIPFDSNLSLEKLRSFDVSGKFISTLINFNGRECLTNGRR